MRNRKDLPGFVAEVSLYKPTRYYCVAKVHLHHNTSVYPAQFAVDWENLQGPLYYFEPGFCPPGLQPVLVKTGGEKICLRYADDFCIFVGTPHEKCWAGPCINWQTTLEEEHWECQLPTLTAVA